MKISTKTLTSLLLVTAVAAAIPGVTSKVSRSRHRESQFDKLLQHHDRKGELRAEILGIAPLTFKELQKHMPLEGIVRRSGFSNTRAFRLALFGKLKDELRHRGWTAHRINRYVIARSGRLG